MVAIEEELLVLVVVVVHAEDAYTDRDMYIRTKMRITMAKIDF